MTNFFTLLVLVLSTSLLAEVPSVPEYGKLLLIEERKHESHFEWGLDGAIALDNSTEDVLGLNVLVNYVWGPLWTFGIEGTANKTQEKDYLQKLEDSGGVKITSYTPDFFTQVTARLNLIKGHANIVNKIQSPFEVAFILGSGIGYNTKLSKSSSLISWGGELLIPATQKYKAAIGLRHYKSYAFKADELSFTSLLLGLRREF